MIDLIFSLEGKILEFIMHALPNSGTIACDIAAAFPSLSRRFLFWVLKTMCIYSLLLRITKSLHLPSNARICVRNLLFMLIEIANGVKQGDPSAMVLFIIAYEPLIRFIDAALQSVDHLLLPYCDDLAIACTDIVNAWKIIVRCFRAIKKMCS